MKEELKRAFNPEFLNRLDDVIVFHPLSRSTSSRSSAILLQGRRSGVSPRRRSTLKLTDAATEFLVTHGYDEKFGARPLKRAIQRYIEDPLSEKILVGGVRAWRRDRGGRGRRRRQAGIPRPDPHA